MKLKLNREYAVRHLGVAAMFVALCCWFLYDGAVDYPRRDDAFFAEMHIPRERAIRRQFEFSGLCALAALVIALRVGLNARRTLEWDETSMRGTIAGGRPLAFADVDGIDDRRWKKKGILLVYAKDGRRLVLDAWHHSGVDGIAARLGVPDAGPTDSPPAT